jgi:hypothetical protein
MVNYHGSMNVMTRETGRPDISPFEYGIIVYTIVVSSLSSDKDYPLACYHIHMRMRP